LPLLSTQKQGPKGIAYHLAKEVTEVLNGEIEIDEIYSNGTCKGKRGRDVSGKVYTVVVENGQSFNVNALYNQ
jgi:hypothetical protein